MVHAMRDRVWQEGRAIAECSMGGVPKQVIMIRNMVYTWLAYRIVWTPNDVLGQWLLIGSSR